METHVLVGAEAVTRAANIIQHAAEDFLRAVANLETENRRHEEAMREIAERPAAKTGEPPH